MEPVLVTGAGGTVGRHLVPLLLESGTPVRTTITRPASSRPVPESDVSTVRFDFTDATTWDAAFTGVRRMFLLRPPELSRPERDLIPALERARALGVEHVVFLSVQGAGRNRVVPHAAVERWLRESGLSWTFLRASFFMQNLTGPHGSDIQRRSEILVPAGCGATAFVDAADVAQVAAAALLHPETHRGRVWTPTGPEALRYDQVAEILSRELGRPIAYRRPGLVRYAVHARRTLRMPLPMVAVTSVIYTAARLGLADDLTDDVRTVTGRRPTDLREFAQREAGRWNRD